MKKLLLATAVFVLGAVVGVAAGVRMGVWEFVIADAQYKASILVSEIQQIKRGRAQSLVGVKEVELNGELARHGQYLESRLWWLLPELRSKDEAAIRRAVAYRLANPYQMPEIPRRDDDFSRQVAEGLQRQDEYLRKVLEHYRGVAAPEGAK